MKLRAALFDLDGVLVDTEPLEWLAYRQAVQPYGVTFPLEEFFPFIGRTSSTVAQYLVEKHRLPISVAELRDQKISNVSRLIRERPIPVMPYAIEFLEFLSKKRVLLGVATNSRESEGTEKLKRAGLLRYFRKVSFKSDVLQSKPAPDIYEDLIKQLDVNAGECIAFEDSASGVQAAKSAGIACFAIQNKFNQHHDLAIADRVFRNLGEAMDWVGKEFKL